MSTLSKRDRSVVRALVAGLRPIEKAKRPHRRSCANCQKTTVLRPGGWWCRSCLLYLQPETRPAKAPKPLDRPSGIKPPKHPPDVTFDCGCTESHNAFIVEKHWLPPNPSCPACGDYGEGGKIRDKHRHIKPKNSVGECTPGGERQGYTYHTEEEQFASKDGWTVVGKKRLRAEQEWEEINILATGLPKRPRGRRKTTTPNLEVTKLYMVDVANEVAERHKWILELEGGEFMLALDMVTNLLLARGKSANARLLAEWLPFSKSTIYNRRKKGEKMFEQLDRIEASLQRIENAQAEHAVEMFRRLYGVSEEDMEVTEEEFDL